VTAADGCAVVFVIGVVLYVCLAFADFGAGIWDFTSGGLEAGAQRRALIDGAVSPVWEANHVWLIFLLVVCWTAFGEAFASIMTTLFVPLALAALGIVLRASNFAFRKEATRTRRRHLTGWLFGTASLLTPFFLGVSLGAVITGRVPVGNAAGSEVSSWVNAPSILIGLMAIAIGAFLAATYLIAEAHEHEEPGLEVYFQRRSLLAGVVALGLGIAALFALRADTRQMYDRFIDRAWVVLLVSAIALGVALFRIARGLTQGTRVVAAFSVALVVAAWGIAQYPYLLPFSLDIDNGAGSPATMKWVLIWFLIALVTVIPALVLLLFLDQRGELIEEEGLP
jgi:cytochrome d ubiquinol oxidase subunit II